MTLVFIILRLLSLIYTVGVFLFIFNAISYLTFSKQKNKVQEAFKRVAFGFIWPVISYSKEGRKKLIGYFSKF